MAESRSGFELVDSLRIRWGTKTVERGRSMHDGPELRDRARESPRRVVVAIHLSALHDVADVLFSRFGPVLASI